MIKFHLELHRGKGLYGGAMVEYTTNPLMPGRKFFRCERMRATLTTDACCSMWQHESATNDGKHSQCRLCPLGAEHAGETDAAITPLKGTLTCGRCHRGASRLIGGHVCPSCYNREREVLVGRNAKGTAPVKHCGLAARRIRYQSGGRVCVLVRAKTVDIDELVVAALRDNQKRVVFAFDPSPPAGMRQTRLW